MNLEYCSEPLLGSLDIKIRITAADLVRQNASTAKQMAYLFNESPAPTSDILFFLYNMALHQEREE